MKIITSYISFLVLCVACGPEALSRSDTFDRIRCSFRGVRLYGKVQIVNSFPDIRVKVVNSFPDLKVRVVNSFPDRCGKWQFVNTFPDFKIQLVESFADIKIMYVNSFPGVE